jgi:hypothetical protein
VAVIRSTLSVNELRDWAKSYTTSYCVARVGTGSEGLLFDTPKSRVKAPTGCTAGVVTDKAITPVLIKMLSETEVYSTVRLNEAMIETYTHEEIMDMIRPYVGINKASFESMLISFSTMDQEKLTSDQKFILAKKFDMRTLRVAMVELEMAKSYLTSLDDESLLEIEMFQGLDELKAVRYRRDKMEEMPFLYAVTEFLESSTFVICGANELGKTPLCRAIAARYAKARNVDYFAQSSTVDSLRMLSVQGFFRPYTAVVLDEWRIGKDSQDAQGHKVDFIKCLTDVENPGAVRLRYSDVRFAPYMPRLISSQQTMEDWIEALSEAAETDRNAILKRLIFVEVTKCLVPASVSAARQSNKGSELKEAFKAVGLVGSGGGSCKSWAPRSGL